MGVNSFVDFDKQKRDYKEDDNSSKKVFDIKVGRINNRLRQCSTEGNFTCKYCGGSLVNKKDVVVKKEIHCTTRICMKRNCIKMRYALNHLKLQGFGLFGLTAYKDIDGKEYYGFNDNVRVRHFAISFKRSHFPKGWKYAKKRCERIINKLFQRLRKGNKIPDGFRDQLYMLDHTEEYFFKPQRVEFVRVFDVNRTEQGDLLHFHFATKPEWLDWKAVQWVRKEIMKKSRNKEEFHIKFFNEKQDYTSSSKSCLGYLALRMTGIYGKNKWITDIDVDKALDDKGVYMLRDLISLEMYVKDFYNSRVLYFSRGISYSCITANISTYVSSLYCEGCGLLEKSEIYFGLNVSVKPPPFDFVPSFIEKNPEITWFSPQETQQKNIWGFDILCGCGLKKEFGKFCEFCFEKTTPQYKFKQKQKECWGD